MKKVLIVTTVSGFVPQFEMNNVKILQNLGFEVHYATNYNTPSYGTDNSRLDGTNIIRHQIDFVRSPFAIKDNKKVYDQLFKLMTEIKFDLVHCHTPMGAAMARMIAKKTQTKPVFYTVHGFHFYKGAPIINWLVYYPVEKILSKYTDVLITINKEDYLRAQTFRAKKVQYIPGVGIQTDKIKQITIDRNSKLKELGLSEDTHIILSVGELIKRKNFDTAIVAFAKAKLHNSVLLICGHGIMEEELKTKARQLGVEEKVIFLGYRNDIHEIMRCSDVFFFPSYQEGLSAALMEAMAGGLPIVCSKIRGNIDLIEHGKGGYLYSPSDIDGFANALSQLILNHDIRSRLGDFNKVTINKFDIRHINEIMFELYNNRNE